MITHSDTLSEDIDLGVLVCLNTLTLNECVPKVLLSLISQVSSPHIRQIGFTVPIWPLYWENMSYMRDIDTVLQRSTFAQLHAVKIDQKRGRYAPMSSTGWMRDRLPLLLGRGIVHHRMVPMPEYYT